MQAFAYARTAGLPIIFDVDYRPYSWISPEIASEILTAAAEQSDMIVGNDEEFGFMAGGIEKGLDKARELSETSASMVIYKMGSEGAITFFADGYNLRDSILRGSASASITVSRPGCAPAMADTNTLKEFMAVHPGPTNK
jgi:5-dehydro-2-deoxygluconokinase